MESINVKTVDKHSYQAIVSGVLSLIIVGVVLGVGTMVYAKIAPNIVGTDAGSNSTIDSINANVYAGLNLGAISPLVLAASLVLGIVMTLGAWSYMGQ